MRAKSSTPAPTGLCLYIRWNEISSQPRLSVHPIVRFICWYSIAVPTWTSAPRKEPFFSAVEGAHDTCCCTCTVGFQPGIVITVAHADSNRSLLFARPFALALSSKRPRCSLDGGGGSGNDTKVSVSLSVNPAKKKKKKKREKREKTRTPTGAGSSTSSSPPPASAAAPRPRPDRAATAGTAGAAAAGGTGAPSSVHPAGAARRGVRGAGDGVEVVRHVSVEERIAENQRRRGVIDIRDGGGVAPRVVPLAAGARSAPPGGAARAAARRGGGGGGSGGGSGSGGARRGGGVPCNLAVAEGWTQAAPSSVPLPAKLEASVRGPDETKESHSTLWWCRPTWTSIQRWFLVAALVRCRFFSSGGYAWLFSDRVPLWPRVDGWVRDWADLSRETTTIINQRKRCPAAHNRF